MRICCQPNTCTFCFEYSFEKEASEEKIKKKAIDAKKSFNSYSLFSF